MLRLGVMWMQSLSFEPYSYTHRSDPYSVYRELRDTAPVHFAPASRAWVLSRFEDVSWALRHPEWFSSNWTRPLGLKESERPSGFELLRLTIQYMRHMRSSPLEAARARILAHQDGETHAALRGLVRPGFERRRIDALEKRIREIVDDCLEPLPVVSPVDVISRLADPLPLRVIADLIGIDPAHRGRFKRWADTLLAAGTGETSALDGGLIAAMGEMWRYLRPLIRERRADPSDDLLSQLLHGGDALELSEFEVFCFVQLLLLAGTETTTNLIGNAVDALLAHPDQLERVHADPERWLGPAIEETLRWEGPVQIVNRTTTQEVTRHGVRIPSGAHVVLLLGSANRDERRFENPDAFDLCRDLQGHLAFGLGNHYCLGAQLARLEASVAVERLVPHLIRSERVRPEVEYLDSFLVRGRSRLELRRAA